MQRFYSKSDVYYRLRQYNRLKKNKEPLDNIQLTNYTHEFTSTKSSMDETKIYIKNSLRYKVRHDQTMYKSKKLESAFIEIIESKEKLRFLVAYANTPKCL